MHGIKLTCRNKRRSAFTVVELMIITSILGILAIISIPNYVKSRDNAQRATCIRNLKVIEHAVQEWAFLERKQGDAPYSFVDPKLLGFFRGSRLPVCPGGGIYLPAARVDGVPSCDQDGHTL
jgi:competence protein ComGC